MIRKEKKAIREEARKNKQTYFEVLIQYVKIKAGMINKAKGEGLYRTLKSDIPELAIGELRAA